MTDAPPPDLAAAVDPQPAGFGRSVDPPSDAFRVRLDVFEGETLVIDVTGDSAFHEKAGRCQQINFICS